MPRKLDSGKDYHCPNRELVTGIATLWRLRLVLETESSMDLEDNGGRPTAKIRKDEGRPELPNRSINHETRMRDSLQEYVSQNWRILAATLTRQATEAFQEFWRVAARTVAG